MAIHFTDLQPTYKLHTPGMFERLLFEQLQLGSSVNQKCQL